jgi:predicted RNA-binding Zn-ribbon protein involved in translation (DUF1610 family)
MSEKKEMTREEASEILSDKEITCLIGKFHGGKEALDLALTALRPVSREQVEKVWRGEWEKDSSVQVLAPGGQKYHFRCSKCGYITRLHDLNFCSKCGTPMTDEAVQMVMERLEVLHDKDV